MRFLNLLKKENGSALVMVMITFMVVAMLGSAVATSSIGEVKQSVALDKDMRAYYQARSAADATMHYIEGRVNDLDTMADNLNNGSYTTQAEADAALADYDAAVDEFEKIVPPISNPPHIGTVSSTDNIISDVTGLKVWREDPGTNHYIYVEATANVYGVSSSATVRLDEKGETGQYNVTTNEDTTHITDDLFKDAIRTGDIDIDGNSYSIHGDVHYSGTETVQHETNIVGNYGTVPAKDLEDLNPPAYIDAITPTKTWPADLKSGHYTGISNSGGGNYTINTTGVSDEVILHIDMLDAQSNTTITATGPGKVLLYIDGLVNPSQKIKLNVLNDSQKAYVYLYFDKSVTNVQWDGNQTVNAFIYAPNALVDLGGNPSGEGAVMCKNFAANGKYSLTYRAPNLTEDDVDGGHSTPTTEVTTTEYDRQNSGIGRQWIGE